MTKRRTLIGLLLLTVAAVSAVGYYVFRTPRAVLLFDQLVLGMTRAEVEGILGTTDEEFSFLFTVPPLQELGDPTSGRDGVAYWNIDRFEVVVYFFQERLQYAALFPSPQPTWFERLRKQLGL